MVKPVRNTSRDRDVSQTNSIPRKCGYKGVRKRYGRWISQFRVPKSRDKVWLGTHDTPEKAARAYDAAVYCFYGHTGTFNFPMVIPPPNIPLTRMPTYKEIQDIASFYANQTPVVLVTDEQVQGSLEQPTGQSSSSVQESVSSQIHASVHVPVRNVTQSPLTDSTTISASGLDGSCGES